MKRIGFQKKKTFLKIITLFVAALFAAAGIVSVALTAKEEKEDVNVSALGIEGSVTNFLIMGVDKSERLADVIMLVSYDTVNSTISVAQLPRDTYAEYTSSAYRKMNGAVSSLGGGREVADFLGTALGIRIDHYITVDLDGVARAVDLLGGVEVNVPWDMSYEDEYQGLRIELKAGKNLLDGEMAKQFIRYRSGYVRGDIARLDAQKLFLSALLNKLAEKGTVGLVRPMATLISESESDLDISDCMLLASGVAKIHPTKIYFMTFPGGDVRTDSGAWYYVINKKQTLEMLKKYFHSDAEYSEFDREGLFTGVYSKEFNTIYNADSGYEAEVYTADGINRNGINIERINN